MLLVTALDVLTRVPLAATVLPHDGSERAGLRTFIDEFKTGMVLLVDRGFPAKDLLASLVARGADVRVQTFSGAWVRPNAVLGTASTGSFTTAPSRWKP